MSEKIDYSKSKDVHWSSEVIGTETWPDFDRMFQRHKGCGGCWCTYHLCSVAEFEHLKSDERRKIHENLVSSGTATGVICYLDGVPVGWCQFGPAGIFEHTNRKRTYQVFDKTNELKPDWRISCVFVDKAYRRQGLGKKVLAEAIATIQSFGGGVTEAFPIVIPGKKRPEYTGSVEMYQAEGFREVAQLGKYIVLMRAIL
jgi:GNAT superfamily N-acetyltransferase